MSKIPTPIDAPSGAAKVRTRVWIFGLLAVLVVVVGIWMQNRKPVPEKPGVVPLSESTALESAPRSTVRPKTSSDAALENDLIIKQTNITTAPEIKSPAPEIGTLRERIKELEAEVATMSVQPAETKTNTRPAWAGTWISGNNRYNSSTASTNMIARITISIPSGAGTGLGQGSTIHLWEHYGAGDIAGMKVLDWGEVPLILYGSETDQNTAASGFAAFTVEKGQRGFVDSFKLYLFLRFEPTGIWAGRGLLGVTNSRGGVFSKNFFPPHHRESGRSLFRPRILPRSLPHPPVGMAFFTRLVLVMCQLTFKTLSHAFSRQRKTTTTIAAR